MNPPLLKFLVRHKIALANLSLIVILAVGTAYLLAFVVRVNPLQQTYDVSVHMTVSGGLLPGNDVAFRGERVGRVESVEIADDGIVAVARIKAEKKIPLGGTVAVRRLSAAGEQFIDFRPESDTGPYLEDGATVDAAHVSAPVAISSVLSNMSGFIDGLNPDRLDVVIGELDKALAGGPDQLRSVISGMSVAMAGLNTKLPQTQKLISSLETIADTTSQVQPDLGRLVSSSGILFEQLTAADQEVRDFLERGPGQLATLNGVVSENLDPMTNLVTNFVAITRAARLRTSAMSALFPALRVGSEALGVPVYDNEFHTLVDILPRPSCEYDTIPVGPTNTDKGPVRLYNYCVTDNPALQIRGSANAPRPDVPDNTSGPPPGVTGDEMSLPPR
ncbi:MCE family protein [Aldersonia kunmingensis]|uniref:MCE family protein n=1 Tax=Aldersonia kunmingensis TaxID=408066 RepID=UPI0008367E6F|nr:MCE family protein [Aldersonia kunmingensis]